MKTTPYHGFRFPKAIIQHAIWLYLRFTLSVHDVEELLAERGIIVTYETIRVWVARFGPMIAKRLRRSRGSSSGVWHLDEMVVKIGGWQMYLWRAVDSEGEVLDMLVQSRRDKRAAVRLMRKLLKKQGIAPVGIVTDRLKSYGSAARELGLSAKHIQGKRKNNRAEGSRAGTKRQREILLPEGDGLEHRPIRAETRATLVRSIALGRRWLDELINGTMPSAQAIAQRACCSQRHVERMLSLAFLAPDLVRATVEGRLPRAVGVSRLIDPPTTWWRQWQILGCSSSCRYPSDAIDRHEQKWRGPETAVQKGVQRP